MKINPQGRENWGVFELTQAKGEASIQFPYPLRLSLEVVFIRHPVTMDA